MSDYWLNGISLLACHHFAESKNIDQTLVQNWIFDRSFYSFDVQTTEKLYLLTKHWYNISFQKANHILDNGNTPCPYMSIMFISNICGISNTRQKLMKFARMFHAWILAKIVQRIPFYALQPTGKNFLKKNLKA